MYLYLQEFTLYLIEVTKYAVPYFEPHSQISELETVLVQWIEFYILWFVVMMTKQGNDNFDVQNEIHELQKNVISLFKNLNNLSSKIKLIQKFCI